MKKPTKMCKCPPTHNKFCRCRTSARDCNDVTEIIRALAFEDAYQRMRRPKAPQFQTKKFIPPHYKDTCVPMKPSMHTRLRLIGHCDPFPPEKPYYKRPPSSRSKRESAVDFASTSEDVKKKVDTDKKRVRYLDLVPGDITMPIPTSYVLHTDSDKAIFQMPSPKTSGENISAEKATVKPADLKPPIPAKSGFDLYKPHSGIILNRDMDFVPDVVYAPGQQKVPRKPKKKKPCRLGGVCRNITCKNKKCRKYNAKRRRLQAKRKRKRGRSYDSLYTVIGGGATDGKPRSRTSRKYVPDDEAVCGLDDIPRPEHVTIPMGLKKGSFKTHSLTVLPCTKDRKPEIHYGILTGSFNMYDGKYSARSRGRQALTMSVMAYCLAFHYHPKQWTMKLVDNLVDAGDQWFLQCADKVHDHSAVQGMCEVLPFGKKQTLLLNGRKMQVLLCEPDVVGYTMSLDPTVYNLCRGLRAFFGENRAGVLLTRFLKVVIWKDKICYYIFDPAGRNSKAYSNFATGSAALMNVKDVDSVSEVLLARSVLEDQKFVLAPVKVLKMVDEKCDEDFESDKDLTLAEKAMMSYRIMNENCAIVNANMHLGDKCFEEAKFRQALPIAVAAMTYAKISPPNTWFTKTLDKILRLGNKLYVDCAHPKVMIDLSIDNIPNEIMVGPYACEIIIYRDRVKGQLFATKECFFNIRTGLEEFFSHEYNSGILDFNNYALAIWRQKDMFYLFDPYPRTNDGLRSMKIGKACCLMLLNPSTMAEVFTKNWDYLPATTQFYVHAFKVLKLTKKQIKAPLFCTLSDENLPGAKTRKKQVLHMSKDQGDSEGLMMDVLPVDRLDSKPFGPKLDEEKMGDIISLVDSIQDDYIPPVPLRYKNMAPEPLEPKVFNLDSPTVSVTQVVPPWPKPRDKTNEIPEPDPDPEPTPPPTPPALPVPEGGVEEEEVGEEEEDEETADRKKEEAARKKAEEEEARRKEEELPPPMPPPPPSPQPEAEEPLAPMEIYEDEVPQTMEPLNVDRRVLLAEDAKYRQKLRQIRKKITNPLIEPEDGLSVAAELDKPHNFVDLPDKTQMIRGTQAIAPEESADVLPFVAIMAIVTSYKYTINTWTKGIVDFVIESAKQLHQNKKGKFQFAPLHIIPKIGIGSQAYNAIIDVVGEGPTWQLENVLARKLFNKLDRGIITTSNYSCAVFLRNGLYYLYDGSTCNAMGLRSTEDAKDGKSCFLRFKSLHDLVSRILYNKDGKQEDEQFILSRIIVRRLLPEARYQLPEDYDYAQGLPRDKKSKQTLVVKPSTEKQKDVEDTEPKSKIGYQSYDGVYRIEGTTALSKKSESKDIKPCHFVCLMAMLMAAMHPLRTWDHVMVDTCIEKGLEISKKAINLNVCEKRVIKNVILDGKFININITKIIIINENPEKTLEQYLKAVLARLRYVMVRFPGNSLVVCQTDGYYHLFDPYSSPAEYEVKKEESDEKKKKSKDAAEEKKKSMDAAKDAEKKKKSKDSAEDVDKKKKSKEAAKEAEKKKKSEDAEEKKKSKEAAKEAEKKKKSEDAEEKKKSKEAAKDVEKKKKSKEASEEPDKKIKSKEAAKDEEKKKKSKEAVEDTSKLPPFASWTLYRSLDSLMSRIRNISGKSVDNPEFYTFELSSIKTVPRQSALNYRLSPLFRPEQNPNLPYIKRRKSRPLVDEKMYWLNIDVIPWSRVSPVNDLGFKRKTPKTMWKDWDIEFPGDLYSLWGEIHPLDDKFDEKNRGKQYLATCVIALAMTQACNLSAWTGSFIDGIVTAGDAYHTQCAEKVGSEPNHEIVLEDLNNSVEMYPYTFTVKFENVIFGFVYNIYEDRFNLGKALSFFFENYSLGILTSPTKNLAFGKMGISYFMFDCQSYGKPVFSIGNGAAYMLKCESLNRLIYCMTITLNLKRHGQQFHLFNATIAVTEKTK